MFIVSTAMFLVGFTESDFFKFGPSKTVHFFKIPVDTWGKWTCVVVYTVFNQLIQTYGLETISPWMINEIQNRKVKTIQYSPKIVQAIIQIWYIYMWSGRIFGIQIMLSQFDFLLVVLISDLFATALTTRLYLTSKRMVRNAHTADNLIPDNPNIGTYGNNPTDLLSAENLV